MKKILNLVLTLLFTFTMQVNFAQSRETFIEQLDALESNNAKGQLEVLDKAIKKFPKDADLYDRRANVKKGMEVAFSKKDTYGFMADYTKAIECENVAWRYSSRANAKVGLDDFKGALADDDIAVAMATKSGDKQAMFTAYHSRVTSKSALRDMKGVIEDYTMALKYIEDPKGSFAASCYSSMADYAEEAKDFNTALKHLDTAATLYKELNDDT